MLATLFELQGIAGAAAAALAVSMVRQTKSGPRVLQPAIRLTHIVFDELLPQRIHSLVFPEIAEYHDADLGVLAPDDRGAEARSFTTLKVIDAPL